MFKSTWTWEGGREGRGTLLTGGPTKLSSLTPSTRWGHGRDKSCHLTSVKPNFLSLMIWSLISLHLPHKGSNVSSRYSWRHSKDKLIQTGVFILGISSLSPLHGFSFSLWSSFRLTKHSFSQQGENDKILATYYSGTPQRRFMWDTWAYCYSERKMGVVMF